MLHRTHTWAATTDVIPSAVPSNNPSNNSSLTTCRQDAHFVSFTLFILQIKHKVTNVYYAFGKGSLHILLGYKVTIMALCIHQKEDRSLVQVSKHLPGLDMGFRICHNCIYILNIHACDGIV